MYEIFDKLRTERGVSVYRVSKDTGVSQATLSAWKAGNYTPKTDKLQRIAAYFNVSLDYLMGKESSPASKKAPVLTKKDERDISKKLEETLNQLESSQDGLMFDGEPMDDITRELLLTSLRNSMEMGKKIAKQKYTPKKYR